MKSEEYKLLPTKWEGCTCPCHTNSDMVHFMPCCYPGMPKQEPLGKEFEKALNKDIWELYEK